MCGNSSALYSMILMLCGRICLRLFRIPIICEHVLVILSECFFQFKFESTVKSNKFKLFNFFYVCIIYFRDRWFNSSVLMLNVKYHKLGFCYIK